jgi:hypothetical protein
MTARNSVSLVFPAMAYPIHSPLREKGYCWLVGATSCKRMLLKAGAKDSRREGGLPPECGSGLPGSVMDRGGLARPHWLTTVILSSSDLPKAYLWDTGKRGEVSSSAETAYSSEQNTKPGNGCKLGRIHPVHSATAAYPLCLFCALDAGCWEMAGLTDLVKNMRSTWRDWRQA